METEVEAPSVSVEEIAVAETESSPRDDIDAILREFGNIACVGCNRNCDSCPLKGGNPDNSELTSDKSPNSEDNVLVNGVEVESTPEIPPSPSYKELLSDDAVPIVVARPRRQTEVRLVSDEFGDSTKPEKSDESEPIIVAEAKPVGVFSATIEPMGEVADKTSLVKEMDDEPEFVEPEAIGILDYSEPIAEQEPVVAKSDNHVVEAELKPDREVFIKVKHVAKPRLVVKVSEKETVVAKESDFSEDSEAVPKTLDESEITQLVIEDDEIGSDEAAVVCEDLIGAEDAYGETTGDLVGLETKVNEITDDMIEPEIEADDDINAFSDDVDDNEEIVIVEKDEALPDDGDIDEVDDLNLTIENNNVKELDKPKKPRVRRHHEKIVEVEEMDEDEVVAQDLTQSFSSIQSYRDNYDLVHSLGLVAVRAKVA